MAFITGQRYINNADLQLGLGRVVSDNHRMVKVAFDAVGEERIYAKDSAPLSRYVAQVDDPLQHKDGWVLTVKEVKNLNGLNIYFGEKANGEEDVIPETEIADHISLDRPADRLLNAQIDKQKWYDVRQMAWAHQQRLWQSSLYGLTGCRTALLPHQIYIAHTVGKRHAPRVLLADEVGLGKTIEACLILHQQLLTNRAQRAVIIVPESLTHQWMVELLRRFNLSVSVFDEEKCQQIETSSGLSNPFEAAQLVLCPLSMLLANPLRAEQLQAAGWDLLVVDEAHHLVWNEGADADETAVPEAVQAYQMVESLTQHIPGVLLLTATPEQLGRKSHFARLRLLDPDRFHDYETFIAQEATFEQVADVIEQLILAETNDEPMNLAALTAALAPHIDADLLQQIQGLEAHPEQRQAVINQLLDQHGTGRVLFRNTRQSVAGFPARHAHFTALDVPPKYTESAAALTTLTPETTGADAADFEWLTWDPRVAWLVSQIKSLRPAKVLVIAHHARTVLQLERHFREQHGLHVALFHEGMSLIERDQAAAWFADMDNGAQVLLCSEIGSEGRNFQFAHHLLMFDLPDHPDLLEQRIGRLDRIGQTETIQIHVPYLKDTLQAQWQRWYHEGLDLFTQPNPAAHQVYSTMHETLSQPQTAADLDRLIAHSRQLSEGLLATMHQGRDRLLEYNSCRPAVAAGLLKQATELAQGEALESFMHRVFDLFGVHHEEHRSGSEIIRPTDEMHGYFPGLLDDGMTITFDRDIALANETFHYLTWEHPMVTEVLDLILSQEQGNTAFAVLQNSGLNAGQMFLECRYVIQATGRSQMQLSRYLPPINQRYLLAEMGVDVGDKLTENRINQFKNSAPMNVAVEVLKAKLGTIKNLLAQADQMMTQAMPAIKQVAERSMRVSLNAEIERLRDLAAHHGQVRDEEIEYLQGSLQQATTALNQTQPQLDSVRVLVTM
ncbi:RNA polymerase-associated protein RapA [Marinicella meishanensis]|uniref:RNA polymerase-associated protein RapA n=1 Tax=Marinicella meishanensis TaxID=2873263 RepID=UPI001CBAD2B7|nr:RNA polymerase-associated protein RapA [Marinicella sp. NBU2979]